MIDTIIDLINNNIDGIDDNEMILGLSQRVYRQSSEEIEYLPGIIKQDGEIIYVGIDDIKSLMIYHKANSANLTFTPRNGFGDSKENEDGIQCNCIVAWDTRKINLVNVDMMLLVRSRFPQEIRDIPNIQKVAILPNAAMLSTKQIFDTEYSFDKQYILPAYISLIQINYTILIKYDQQCIDKCITCKQ